MNRLELRVVRLEQDAEQERDDRPYWWQLPDDQWRPCREFRVGVG